MKTRKILSLVMAVILLCTVCFVGSTAANAEAVAVVSEDGNYLLNGSFELVESREEGTLYGFKDYALNHGGTGVMVDYWKSFNWLINNGKSPEYDTKTTHTTDAHSGSYALRYDIKAQGGNSNYLYTTAFAKQLPEGYFTLSAWVKGTNTASTINVFDAQGNAKSVNLAASDDWQKITIDNINGIGTTTVNGVEVIGITITPKKNDTDTYFIIDDICLEKTDAPEAVLLSNGSLENATTVWDSEKGKYGAGFANKIVGHGQSNLINDGWYGTNYLAAAPARIYTDHSTDAHSGSYSLKINIPASSNTLTLYPAAETLNTAAITEGYYTLSAWVKGNNTAAASKIEISSTATDSETALVLSAAMNAESEWKKVSIYDVYLTDGATNVATYGQGLFIKFNFASSSEDTYICIDDITLTKQDVFYNGGMEIKGTKDVNYAENGQANPNTILQGFTMQDWSGKKTLYDIVTGEDVVHSGNSALKITYSATSIAYSRYDGKDIAPGMYKISGWAKGNSANAVFRAYQATVDAPTTEISDGKFKKNFKLTDLSETEWKYYEFVFTVYENHTIKRTLENKQTSVYFNALGFGIAGGTAGEYAIFDDIKFERVDDAQSAANSITGIDLPEIGDTALKLPEVDAHIEVSIAASSDESVIALDGTISPLAGRVWVDVTLAVSDGTNTVTLDPIGVVVPGTAQVEIDNVKREIKLLPNDNALNPILPTHFEDFVAVREAFNALDTDAKEYVTNAIVLGQRENAMANYGAVLGEATLSKDGQLRIKAAYPTKFADGFTVKEYGVLFIPAALAEDENITLDTENVSKSVMSFVPTEADSHFYTVLKNSALEGHSDKEILMRSYVTYEYTENDEIKTTTVYSRFTVTSSVDALNSAQ